MKLFIHDVIFDQSYSYVIKLSDFNIEKTKHIFQIEHNYP
jgi:hypothetical protein